MLTTLTVKHYTIVDELMLDFGEGMSVFTGETGAGKSITLDALGLTLGAKTDSSVVRTGCSQCDITAVFDITTNPDVKCWLNEQDLASEDPLTLRRVINQNGRSKSLINGIPYPLQKVRELGERLVNIHGQHQQYHLLNEEHHRAQLDAFSMTEALLKDIRLTYTKYQQIQKRLQQLQKTGEKDSRLALLRYQVKELDELDLSENEFEILSAEYKLLSQQKQFIEGTYDILQYFDSDENAGLLSHSDQVMQLINDIEHPGLKSFSELMNNAQIHLQEAHADLLSFQSQLEQDPERLQVLEKRLAILFDVARKHQVKPNELQAFQTRLQAELTQLTDSDVQIDALVSEQHLIEEKLRAFSKKLHNKRQKEAKVLSKQITQTIQSLGMPNAEMDVRVESIEKFSPHGMDKVEYYVCLNKGIVPRPLSKIASGGELSRISLAIQVLTAEKKSYPTLIFDEVDTGIGGAQAAKVGLLLRRLGDHTQVLCVTHQAQVAANANWHYQVAKETKKQKTFLNVDLLEKEDKVSELARMISGVKMTKQTIEHARNLLEESLSDTSV